MSTYEVLRKEYENGTLSLDSLRSYVDNLLLDNYYEDSLIGYASRVLTYMDKSYSSDYGTACVYKKKDGGNICFGLSPDFLFKGCKNEDEFLSVLCHEVNHIIYQHIYLFYDYRETEFGMRIVNLASDVHANLGLDNLPSGGFTIDTFKNLCNVRSIGSEFRSVTLTNNTCISASESESIAELCMRVFNDRFVTLLGGSLIDLDEKIKGDTHTSFSLELLKIADGGTSSYFNISSKNMEKAREFAKGILDYIDIALPAVVVGALMGGENELGGIEKDLADLLEDIADVVPDSFNPNKQRSSGSGEGSNKDVNGELEKSEVRWQNVLKLVCRSSMKCFYESTKKKMNRRQMHRLELSGRRKTEVFNVIVACDESGSISDMEYIKFLSEIRGILKEIPCNLTLLRFTSKVKQADTCYSRDSRSVKNLLEKGMSSRYCGGTSFQCVFDCLDKNKYSKESIVIIFTDGCGENSLDFRGYGKRKWVLTDERYKLSVRNEVPRNVLYIKG